MLIAKYFTHQTPRIVLNPINFDSTVPGTDKCAKKKITFLFISSLFFYYFSFILRLFLSPVTPSSLFLLLSLSFIYFSCHYLPLSLSCPQPSPIRFWFDSNCVQQRGRRGSKAQLADLCPPSAIADLCSSSSTALVFDLAADGWLSLFIDWSVRLGFCWRFWVFFFFFWSFWI